MQIRFLITNAFGRGGTIHTTFTMANALARRGHDVEVVSVLRHADAPVFHVDEAVRVRSLLDVGKRTKRRRHGASISRRLDSALRARPSRIIHPDDARYDRFNLRSDVALMRYLRSLHGGVLVTTRAGLNLAAARFVRRDVVRIAQEHLHLGLYRDNLRTAFVEWYPRLDAVVTLTERDAQNYRRLVGDRVDVRAIPNAVPDLSGLPGGPDPDTKVAIAAGRLVRGKGFHLLIRAWRTVAQAHPKWRLHIYGTGPTRRRLQRQIVKLDLADHVQLMGFTKHLPAHMAAASLFVLSSRFEGFGMALIEAMACGLPVISFDCPVGPGQIIDDGVNGVLVENGSIDALAAEIIRLIDDPGLRGKLGAAARRAARRYSSDTIADQWEHLFEAHTLKRAHRV